MEVESSSDGGLRLRAQQELRLGQRELFILENVKSITRYDNIYVHVWIVFTHITQNYLHDSLLKITSA